MGMRIKKNDTTAVVDIHGMTVEEAKRALERLLSRIEPEIKEITVIHGYNSGNALQEMVRGKLKHKRLKSKILSLNHGETTLILK